MIKKLKQKSGETLVETLFSILIAVLSMGILCSAVMAANSINMQSREMDNKYKTELNAVEGMNAVEEEDKVDVKTNQHLVITFYPENKQSYSINTTELEGASTTVYGNDDGVFLSYDYNRGGAQ